MSSCYGPPHAFWCFSFERFNGLLGSFHTNQKSIEVQVMRMSINSQLLRRTRHKVQPQFLSLLPFSDSDTPSILPDTAAGSDLECLSTLTMSTSTFPNSTLSFQQMDNVLLLPPLHKHVFSSATMKQLEKLWEQLNPSKHLVRMSPFHVRCGRVMVCGEMVGSVLNAQSCNSASDSYHGLLASCRWTNNKHGHHSVTCWNSTVTTQSSMLHFQLIVR